MFIHKNFEFIFYCDSSWGYFFLIFELHGDDFNFAVHFSDNGLGFFLFQTGAYAEAAEQYEYLVALNPRNMHAYSNLGATQILNAQFQEAIATFNRALEIDPQAIAYSNLGINYFYIGDFEQALAALDKAVALEPSDSTAQANRADVLWMMGRQHDARDGYLVARGLAETALVVNSQDPFALTLLAWIETMLDEHETARNTLDLAMTLAPEDPYTHYTDGLVRLYADDPDGAADAFSVAIDLGYSRELLRADPHLKGRFGEPRFARLMRD